MTESKQDRFDLELLSAQCYMYEYRRQQLEIMRKLTGLEQDIAKGNRK